MRVFSLAIAAAAAAVVVVLTALPEMRVLQVLVLPVFLCFRRYQKAGGAF